MFLNKLKRNVLLINAVILVGIFTLSIWLRVPNIKEQQYMGKNHEWITAHALLTNSIWYNNGGSKYYWAPVYTYNYEQDKTHPIFNHLIDKNGNRYYASYPPLTFYFTYFIFKISNTKPNVLGIRCINLSLQFISGVLLVLIISILGNKSIKKHVFLPAIIGFLLYTFNASNLWINGNIYFADMLAQPFFIAIVYCLLLLLTNTNDKLRKRYSVYLCVLSFLIVYSEWIGVLLLFVIFIVLLASKDSRKNIFLIIAMPISGLLAIALTAFQYSLISGWSNFIEFIFNKYKQRSGATDLAECNFTITNPLAHDSLKTYYIDGYYPIFGFLLFTVIIGIIVIFLFRNNRLNYNRNILIALCLAAIPVLLHIILLFNFNSRHYFSIHKSSFPIIIIISSILIFILKKIDTQSIFFRNAFSAIILLFAIATSYFSYTDYIKQINPSFNYKINKLAGDMIKKYGNPNDIIFTNISTCPELMFYSGRNTFTTSSVEESIEYMKKLNGANSGIYIERYGQEVGVVYSFTSLGEVHELWRRKN